MSVPIFLFLATLGIAADDEARGLIERLRTGNWEEREEAERALRALGASAIPVLEEAQDDEDLEVALRARRVWLEATRTAMTVRCVDASGAPLADTDVAVNFVLKQRPGDVEAPPTTDFTGRTDAEGRLPLRVEGVEAPYRFPRGDYFLRVWTEGRLPWMHEDFPLRGGEKGASVVLPRGAAVTGTWEGAPDTARTHILPQPPVAESWVNQVIEIEDPSGLLNPDGQEEPGYGAPRFETKEDLAPGRYRLALETEASVAYGPALALREGERADPGTFRPAPPLAPGTRLRVRPGEGWPEGAEANALSLEGRLCGWAGRTTEGHGSSIEECVVEPGWWRAGAATSDGACTRSGWTFVGPGESKDLDLPRPAPPTALSIVFPSRAVIREVLATCDGPVTDVPGMERLQPIPPHPLWQMPEHRIPFEQPEEDRVSLALPAGTWTLRVRATDGRIGVAGPRTIAGGAASFAVGRWIGPGGAVVRGASASDGRRLACTVEPLDPALAASLPGGLLEESVEYGEPARLMLPPGLCEAAVYAPDGSVLASASAWIEEGKETLLDLIPPPKRRLDAREIVLHDAEGRPVLFAQASLGFAQTLRSDGEGRIPWGGGVPWAPFLRVDHPEHATRWILPPWPREPVRLEPARTLRGRVVTPEGTPLSPGGRVLLLPCEGDLPAWAHYETGFSPEILYLWSPIDAEGNFAIEGAGAHEGWLLFEHPTLAAAPCKFRPEGAEELHAEVRALPAATATVRLSDEAGAPIPGAVSLLSWDAGAGGPGDLQVVAVEDALPDGSARLLGIPQGRLHLVAESPGFGARLVETIIAPGENAIDVRLARGGTVYGTVRGLPEEPAASLRLTDGTLAWTSLSPSGDFVLHGVPAGTTSLGAFSGGRLVATREVTISAGEMQRVTWTITPTEW
ncbi:MAG: hypothetical protein HY608_12105 [Planctomycetes bacterium]|nr:hypothetical protein [Planctomycetota bacterium]